MGKQARSATGGCSIGVVTYDMRLGFAVVSGATTAVGRSAVAHGRLEVGWKSIHHALRHGCAAKKLFVSDNLAEAGKVRGPPERGRPTY